MTKIKAGLKLMKERMIVAVYPSNIDSPLELAKYRSLIIFRPRFTRPCLHAPSANPYFIRSPWLAVFISRPRPRLSRPSRKSG